MAFAGTCACGNRYESKDESARWCPACGALLAAPGGGPLGDPVFARDKFLLHQKHLSINEKYRVWSEQGEALLFVERPAHLGQQLLALFGALGAALVVGALFGGLASVVPESLSVAIAVLAVINSIAALIVVAVRLSPKRHVRFYRDETRSECLLEVLQDHKWAVIHATYTVQDGAGEAIGKLDKNYLISVFRKRWHGYRPDGSLLLVAKEDSAILSLLRRVIGPLLGVLRTNFVILEPGSGRTLGEFNRNFTLLDKYVLDLSADRQRLLDRRFALALGVMLDTGERR